MTATRFHTLPDGTEIDLDRVLYVMANGVASKETAFFIGIDGDCEGAYLVQGNVKQRGELISAWMAWKIGVER